MPTPTLRDVCSELGKVRHKWFTIGVHLGIPRYILEQYKNEDDPLSAAVDYWLRGNVVDPPVPITWEHLVEALKAVNEGGCAAEISRKYCRNQGSRVQNGSAPPSQPSRHSTRAPLSSQPTPPPPSSHTMATPPQSASAQSAPAGSVEFSESMNVEQLCAYLRSEQMPENDLKIIKESGIGGAVFSYASEEDWKAMKISLPGLINIRRIKEKINKRSPASPLPPQSSSQITSQPSPPTTTSPPYSAHIPELREFGVSAADANRKIGDFHMQVISRSCCGRWRELYPYLELNEIVVSDVERTPISEDEKRRAFFRKWMEQKGSDATYGRLIYALLKIGCRSDAESVKQLFINAIL